MDIILAIVAIVLGYFLGSVLPAYLIGKLKGIDITRHKEYKNPGTRNAFRQLGILPGIITAIYDIGKSALAAFIAMSLTSSFLVAILAGIASILGHVFPFYLKFKGGGGMASIVGLIAYLVIPEAIKIVPIGILAIFVILSILFIILFKLEKGGLCILAMLCFLITYYIEKAFALAILILPMVLIAIIVWLKLKKAVKKYSKKEKSLLKRKFLRPFAIVFPIAILFVSKWIVLAVVALPLLYFITMEIIRFTRPKFKHFWIGYKKKEKKKISSMTLFLFSVGLTILVFNKYIAALALLFVIFGDLVAWAIGKSYGKVKILDKTLEGTIACFVICFLIAFVFYKFLQFNLIVGIVGALIATLVELAPIEDDNLAVPLASAIIMTAVSALL